MKIQDIGFIFVFIAVLLIMVIYKLHPKFAAVIGISSLLFSMSLYLIGNLFTAERFVWYGASFFLLSILLYFFSMAKKDTYGKKE